MTRNELWKKLKERRIETRKLYAKLTCDFSCYKDRGYVRKTECADRIKNITLDLPMYGTLQESDVEYICEVINKLGK